ncbi:MAG: hypothetical protein OXO49_06070 [Gammaproteobacteria bacterium]|nr:hypothetical protein [Gammaproteobacteria bacterium]MDE0251913.1 hypothetical protein [Gammaproteobacteria bacterium]MDE0403078.1 hypothetical protein [Gammaproteobacteria bacterium]
MSALIRTLFYRSVDKFTIAWDTEDSPFSGHLFHRELMISRSDEKVINFALAEILRGKHPRWREDLVAESTQILVEQGLQPDISMLARSGGHPVLIETEYAPARTVENDAIKRLGHTLREHGYQVERCMAVRLPIHLSTTPQAELLSELQKCKFEYCIWSETSGNPVRWPERGWISADIDELADGVEHLCVSESAITASLLELDQAVSQCASMIEDSSDIANRKVAEVLCQESGEQTLRMAMSILANALLFHATITKEYDIPAVADFTTISKTFLSTDLLTTWRFILENINYWPIFALAHDLLALIPQQIASRVLHRMNRMLEVLGPIGITTQNDLCGRMFQRLITDRKFLATFYTRPSAAHLLAEIAISRIDIDWSDPSCVKNLRIADFACGTGTLLTAAYSSIASRIRHIGFDDSKFHATIVEQVLTGADIMPAATHLTASILSSVHPGITFDDMNIVTMPYGDPKAGSGHSVSLGSLDLIEDEEALPLFGSGSEFLSGKGKQANKRKVLAHDSFDLVIMNPPFTRPTGHEANKIGIPVPSFAGFQNSNDEQRKMSKRLTDLYKRYSPTRKVYRGGSGQAGLASNFVDLGEAKLKPNRGIIALVLPATFANGKAWANARKLLLEEYDNVVLMAIANDGFQQQAFSDDTSMAEVMLVGRKRSPKSSRHPSILYVNLYQRPTSILEGCYLARQIARISDSSTSGTLSIGEVDRGHYIRGYPDESKFLGIRDLEITKSVSSLVRGILALPRSRTRHNLVFTKLNELGSTGLYHMDLTGKETNQEGEPRGPFDVKSIKGNVPTYPCLWGHSATRETRVIVNPDSECVVRKNCNERALKIWDGTATKLHFNRDFGLASQALSACFTSEKSIGGRAWPNFKCKSESWDIPLLLWANTTLGLILFWWTGTRQQPGRTSVSITTLPELPVLDVRALNDKQLTQLNKAFDYIKERQLLPGNESYRDETRIWLDQFVLFDVLGLPKNELMEPLNLLRRKWSNEPSVHGGKKTRPSVVEN